MIQVRDISKSYGNLQVLSDINLDIMKSEIVSIVGPSGAGKTTLLQIIGTLERPDSGRVLYNDEDVMSLKDARLAKFRNRNIGFVFQFHQLLPEFTVVENVAMPALIGGSSRADAFSKAKELIEYLGLTARADHKPAQLSAFLCNQFQADHKPVVYLPHNVFVQMAHLILQPLFVYRPELFKQYHRILYHIIFSRAKFNMGRQLCLI